MLNDDDIYKRICLCSDDENSRVITYVHIVANIEVFEPCFRLIVCPVAIFSNENYFLWNSFSNLTKKKK